MGSDSSKQSTDAPVQQDTPIKVDTLNNVSQTPKQDAFDPRSPNVEQHRTPFIKTESEELQNPFDPRSPNVEMPRTPFSKNIPETEPHVESPVDNSPDNELVPLENTTPIE